MLTVTRRRYYIIRPAVGTMLTDDYDPKLHQDMGSCIRIWLDGFWREESSAAELRAMDQLGAAAMMVERHPTAENKLRLISTWDQLMGDAK